jgi:hypothetical protein
MIIPPFAHDHANGTLGKAFHIDHARNALHRAA